MRHETTENISNPLDTIIDFAWSAGADRFWVNNAKDELKRLREKSKEMTHEAFKANQFAIEESNRLLDLTEELCKLKSNLDKPVAYAKIIDDGLLYDLRISNNPYDDQTKVVPLYRLNDD